MTSTTARLVRLFRLYPDYFNYYLSQYYVFTKDEIERYKSKLNWLYLSENVFLDWNEDLLLSFKDFWDWWGITTTIFGLKGLSNPELVDKYIDAGLLQKELLSHNENIRWSKEMVLKYGFEHKVLNDKIHSLFKWDLSKIEKHMNCATHSVNFNTLSSLVDIEWNDDIIDKYIDEIDFPAYASCYETVNEGGCPWQYRYEVEMKTKPKEVEEILCLLERYGDKLISAPYKEGESCRDRDYFLFNNPLKNGIGFTFNTEEKRMELTIAVQHFYSDDYY